MNYADLNMGLLGPRFALISTDRCVLHVPGNLLADSLWHSRRKRFVSLGSDIESSIRRVRDSIDTIFAYMSHRDIQEWARLDTHEVCASTFLALKRLRPEAAVIISTKSAPKVLKGFPFLLLLERLECEGYDVIWFTASAMAYGLPHDAHYTVIVCSRVATIDYSFAAIAAVLGTTLDGKPEELGSIAEYVGARTPRLGVTRRALAALPSAGVLRNGTLFRVEYKYGACQEAERELSLGEIVCPSHAHLKPKPVRLVARHGVSGLMFKRDNASYAMGPGTSASPLFAFAQEHVRHCTPEELAPYTNWSLVREGHLIVRLRPSRALLLHGRVAGAWERLLHNATAPVGSQYGLVSRGLPPQMLQDLVRVLALTQGRHCADPAEVSAREDG